MSSEPTKTLPALPESFLPHEHALYRPRHSEHQRAALVAAVLFLCLPGLLLVVGVRPAEFENRRLAEFPPVTTGWAFFTGLDEWADDHIPFRDKAVAIANGISRGVFGEAPPVGDHGQRSTAGPIPVPPKDPSLDRPEPTAYVRAIEGKDDWLYLGADVLSACEPAMPQTEVFDRLRSLRAAVEASGRKFVLVVVPDKVTAVPEFLPARYYGRDCSTAYRERFWAAVGRETGAIDLRRGLNEAAELGKGPVYHRFDSHWTTEGGLVMVRAVAERIQPGVTRTWEFRGTEPYELNADLPPLLGRQAGKKINRYELAPDGERTRDKGLDEPFPEPERSTQARGTGIVEPRVHMLGDSFAAPVASYMSAAFADYTFQHVDGLVDDAAGTGRRMAEADVVVVEVVERNLLAGSSPLLSLPDVKTLEAELAARPR